MSDNDSSSSKAFITEAREKEEAMVPMEDNICYTRVGCYNGKLVGQG